ncbi:MAG: hypothetical protein AABX85_00160 [Nanoarchaeota archaeon]
MATMKQIEDIAAGLMVKPVLDYLEQQSHVGKYFIRNKEYLVGDDGVCGYSVNNITILERMSGFFNGFFPKKIARVEIRNGRLKEVESFEPAIVNKHQLEFLLKSVDFDRLSFAGALAAQQHGSDYA